MYSKSQLGQTPEVMAGWAMADAWYAHQYAEAYKCRVVQIANALIRREIDGYCAWLSKIALDPLYGALEGEAWAIETADTIINLRTWYAVL